MRELHKLIFLVEMNLLGTDVIFQVLAEMGKKRYGVLGIYDLIQEDPSSMLRLLKKMPNVSRKRLRSKKTISRHV
jgi:hypothetical protein